MRAVRRRVRDKLDNHQRAYGIAVQLSCPEIVEVVGYTGYDFVWIDAEHGAFDNSDIRTLIRAADAADIDAIVRVADQNPIAIQHALDLGAAGIIAPDVRDVVQARAIVSTAHFAPVGTRGACPCGRAVGHLTQDWLADTRRMDADTLVIGIVEHPDGVANVDAIASRSGLDGLMFGPFDLSMSLGFGGDLSHPDITTARDRVVRACHDAGIEYVTPNAAWEADLDATGARIIPVTGDRVVLVNSLLHALAEVGGREVPAESVA